MASDNIYQLKITLNGIKPPIWRRIQIPGSSNFNTHHRAIQDAMGWRQCHMYYFEAMNKKEKKTVRIEQADSLFGEGVPDNTVKIQDYLENPKDKVHYEYDMGDSWLHTIMLEEILPEDKSMKYPKCLAGRRACPPEDSGGIYGYSNSLEILKNPQHPEHDEYKTWLEECDYAPFNPDHFDPKDVFEHWES